jgi:hypothetical protein
MRQSLPDGSRRDHLVYQLQMRLYRDFYGRGYPSASRQQDMGGRLRRLGRLVKELSEANSGRGYWEPGWQVSTVQDGVIVARNHELELWASPEEVRSEMQSALGPGAHVRLYFGKESVGLSPGFYFAASDADWVEEDSDQLVRLYWHLRPAGAVTLMREATTRLNPAQLPFRLKVLSDPMRYTRCDAGVLYIKKQHYEAIAELLGPVYEKVAIDLEPTPPAFTKQLAPGLSLAEDTGRGDSFGISRCRILAEGLVQAHERGKRTVRERLDVVIERFGEAGISLERPYLQPGSTDVYTFRRHRKHAPAIRFSDPAGAGQKELPSRIDYVKFAAGIAEDICQAALWDGDCCNWIAADPGPGKSRGEGAVVYRALGPGFYGGTSGIALFLGELYAHSQDAALYRTAIGAIRHAMTYSEDLPEDYRFSFRHGIVGVALAAARLGRILGGDQLPAEGARIIRGLESIRHGLSEGTLRFDPETVAALAVLARMLGRADVLDLAVAAGNGWLRQDNQPEAAGRTRTRKGSGTGPSDREREAMAPYTLLELFAATGECKYREAAEAALESTRASEWNEKGPVGLRSRAAISQLRAYQLTGSERHQPAAMHALQRSVDILRQAQSPTAELSTNDGLLGAAEVVAYGAQILGPGHREQVDLVVRLADSASQAFERERASRIATANAGLGLMSGLSGTGMFLLRRCDPALPSPVLLHMYADSWSRT